MYLKQEQTQKIKHLDSVMQWLESCLVPHLYFP